MQTIKPCRQTPKKKKKVAYIKRDLVSSGPLKVAPLVTKCITYPDRKTLQRAAQPSIHHCCWIAKFATPGDKSCMWFRRGGTRGEQHEAGRKNCPVTVALPRSETLLCKLTLRVCLHCRERRDGREQTGGKDKGVEGEEEEETAEMKETEGRGEH